MTLIIAFVVIVFAIACLAIGWLITGKTKIERGACGRNPAEKKDESCQSVCSLCTPAPQKDEEAEGENSEDKPTTTGS